jgi:S-adenosylmethionine:tRNA ribosyltransferase-isomerase
MRLSDFDYDLPEELIAQEPPVERDAARMLVVHRAEQRFEDRLFREFPSFLRVGDCVVLNDSRVLPSRLLAGKFEVLLLEPVSVDQREWRALVRPGRKLSPGVVIQFEDLSVEIVGQGERGERTVRFLGDEDVYAALDRLGHMPLPPYIKRQDRLTDRDRYQTVFARERGSVAAPTAGLHFTGNILDRVRDAGAAIAKVMLHVGLGTF